MTTRANGDGGSTVDNSSTIERSYAANSELPPEVEALLALLASVNRRIAAERGERQGMLRLRS